MAETPNVSKQNARNTSLRFQENRNSTPRAVNIDNLAIREKNGLNINRNQRQQIRCWQTEEKPVTRTFLIFPDNHEKDGTIVSRTKMHALLCSRSRGRKIFPFRVFFFRFLSYFLFDLSDKHDVVGVNRRKEGVGVSVFLLRRKRKGRLRGDRDRSFDRDALKKNALRSVIKTLSRAGDSAFFFYFTFVT